MSAFLHPEMADILRAMQIAPAPDPATLPIDTARTLFAGNAAAWNLPLPPIRALDETVGGVPCRVLSPAKRRGGVVVFVHGGGWTFGSPDTHDRFARLLAHHAEVGIVVPDYRLAPEHPCPAAIDDVLAVIAGLHALPDLQGPLALCGDSAGANIALAAALASPALPIAALSLLYGCFAPIFDTDSHRENGDGRFGLGTARMRWYWKNWQGPAADARAAPLHADLTGLPRTYLLAAALDPLCDDGFLLAKRLAAYGVPARLDVVPGVVHGFLQMSSRLTPALQAITTIAADLRAALDDKDGGTRT
jgi:acetyl esterase